MGGRAGGRAYGRVDEFLAHGQAP
eukprot:gene17244-biopygen21861